jgi:hypothetical protein
LDELSARRKCLYLHRTTQIIRTRTSIHALSGIQTHDLSVQATKTYASNCANTGTDNSEFKALKSKESSKLCEQIYKTSSIKVLDEALEKFQPRKCTCNCMTKQFCSYKQINGIKIVEARFLTERANIPHLVYPSPAKAETRSAGTSTGF